MKKENKITVNNLIYSIIFFAFGIILLTSTENLISIASKVIGSILVIIGVVKLIVYIYMKGKLGSYKLTELVLGLIIVGCGILLILYSDALSFAIRIIVGMWILFSGINKIILALTIKSVDKTGFKVYLITSLIMILLGILLITGLFDKVIGLFIIGYSIAEIVNYIYFISKGRNKIFNQSKKLKVNKKLKKELKNIKVVDAIVEEEEKN